MGEDPPTNYPPVKDFEEEPPPQSGHVVGPRIQSECALDSEWTCDRVLSKFVQM